LITSATTIFTTINGYIGSLASFILNLTPRASIAIVYSMQTYSMLHRLRSRHGNTL